MFIVADIGGTKTRVAGSDDASHIGEPVMFDTPQNFEEGMRRLHEAAFAIAPDGPQRAVVGVPGILTQTRDSLFRAPHLPQWQDVNIKKRLETELACPVALLNDAALVALGEAHFGAGRGFPIVGYVTVSTGIGGARIVDGAIDKSLYGFEPGHRLLSVHGKLQELEAVVSGAALQEKYGEQPTHIRNPALWEELTTILSQELYNLILDWSPDCLVLGGSLFKEGGFTVQAIEKKLTALNVSFPTLPALKPAELGDIGGLYGGIAYLAQQ